MQKAYDKGSSIAKYNLGIYYKKGTGVKVDYAKAMMYFNEAYEDKISFSYGQIGSMYEDGKGVDKDCEKAIEYYQKGYEVLDNFAIKRLLDIYIGGEEKYRNHNLAKEMLYKLVNQGFEEGYSYLGWVHYLDDEYVDAYKNFKKAEEYEDAYSIYMLGKFYEKGLGVDQDYDLTFKYYEKAAQMDYVNSFLRLGHLYFNGYGTNKDIKKAFNYWKKGSDLGDELCTANLGIIYFNGYKEYPQDYKKAFEYFDIAAKKGSEFAKAHLAECYFFGYGVTKDLKKGYQILKNSSSNDFYMLFMKGVMYYEGFFVEKNYNEAFKWFNASYLEDDQINDVLYYLGRCYYFGQGVTQDKNKAYELLVLAKDLSSGLAENFIKEFYK